MYLNKPDRDGIAWLAVGICLLVTALLISIAQLGCVGVDPSASMDSATVTPRLSAEQIQTAVQTAINSNASIVNDLWPIVAMLLIGVGGLVLILVRVFNTAQTREIKEHIRNGHS